MADLSPLQRQRRFLVLMSLGVIAFYWLQAEVKDTATFSGVGVTLNRPQGVEGVLWVIWGWALLRYGQRLYELLSEVWRELIEDVNAEDQRIALWRAKNYAKRLAKEGKLTVDDPSKKNVVVDGPVVIIPGQPVSIPDRNGGRSYENLAARIRWEADQGPGSGSETFQMKLTLWQVRWLRCRAWAYAIIGLPAFTEHIAPIFLALIVPFAPCFG